MLKISFWALKKTIDLEFVVINHDPLTIHIWEAQWRALWQSNCQSGGQRNDTMIIIRWIHDGWEFVFRRDLYRLVWWLIQRRDNQQIINFANDSIKSHDIDSYCHRYARWHSTSLYDPGAATRDVPMVSERRRLLQALLEWWYQYSNNSPTLQPNIDIHSGHSTRSNQLLLYEVEEELNLCGVRSSPF
jgi:hypothetical protein